MSMSKLNYTAGSVDESNQPGRREAPTRGNPRRIRPGDHPGPQGGLWQALGRRLRAAGRRTTSRLIGSARRRLRALLRRPQDEARRRRIGHAGAQGRTTNGPVRRSLALAFALAAAAAAPAQAQTVVPNDWALKPAGIDRGDQFRLIFATSNERNATASAISTYNTFVQNTAAAGHVAIQAYASGFRVVGCTEGDDARDNTSTTYTSTDKGVPIYWLDGGRVANDYEDFYDGIWRNEANSKNQLGNNRDLSTDWPFTGCTHDGRERGSGASSSALGNGSGGGARVGKPHNTEPGSGPLSSDSTFNKTSTMPFYGLSEVFEVDTSFEFGSNTGSTATATGSNSFHAQVFETSSEPRGYELASIGIRFETIVSKTVVVKIRKGGINSKPRLGAGNVIATLVNPTSPTDGAVNLFTAPPNTILKPDTEYWITISEGVAAAADRPEVSLTNINGQTGWDVGNSRLWRDDETNGWTSATSSLMVEIRGVINRTGTAPDVLVRTGNSPAGACAVEVDINAKAAQEFTTGPHQGAYEVSGLELSFIDGVNTSRFKVSLKESNSGRPGRKIFEFPTPRRINRFTPTTFVPPANAPRLWPDTSYFVVIEEKAAGEASTCWSEAGGTGESGAAGWSVADTRLGGGKPLWIAVRGSATESNEAALSSLRVTDESGAAIALTPRFRPETTRYTATAPSSANTITVTAPAAYGATDVTFVDAAEEPIADDDTTEDGLQTTLAIGANIINTVVATQNGTATKTYELTITREDFGLTALELSDAGGNPIEFAPAITPGIDYYDAFVANAVEQITIEPTANNANATIQYKDAKDNNIADASTTEDGYQIEVPVGVFAIKMVLKQGSTTKDVYVTVTRGGSDDALRATLTRAQSNSEIMNAQKPRWRVDLLLSEPVNVTYDDLIKDAVTVVNGRIDKVVEVSDTRWALTVVPIRALDQVLVSLAPKGRPCGYAGVLCTVGGKQLTERADGVGFRAWGYTGEQFPKLKLRVEDTVVPENNGFLRLNVTLRDNERTNPSVPLAIRLRMRTIEGTGRSGATEGEDYIAADVKVVIPPHERSWDVDLATLIQDSKDDDDETMRVEVSDAWVVAPHGLLLHRLDIQRKAADSNVIFEEGESVQVYVTISAPEGTTDTRGTITLEAPVTHDELGAATFKVVRNGNSTWRARRACFVFETIDTGTEMGTATPGEDYHPKRLQKWMEEQQLTLKVWAQAKSDDDDAESAETIKVQISHARYCDFPHVALSITTAQQTWTITEPPAPVHRFEPSEHHDGRTRFPMQLVLSKSTMNSANDLRYNVLKAQGGQIGNVTPVNGQKDLWEVEVEPDGNEDIVMSVKTDGTCGDPGTLCTEDGEPFLDTGTTTVPGPDTETLIMPLTGAFENAPAEHDGETAFTVELALSAAIENTADELRDHAVKATGATVESVTPVNGRQDLWAIAIAPDGTGEIVLTIEAAGSCGDAATLCTAEGEALAATVRAIVAGPPGAAPLTVRFENVPERHDGQSKFNIRALFSEAPAGVSNTELLEMLEITGGTAIRIRRVRKDAAHRRIFLRPDGDQAITLSLPETTDCADAQALCTSDGGRLDAPVTLRIAGPATPGTPNPFTAEFLNVPEEHDGRGGFSVEIMFSEAPTGANNETIKQVLEVSGGRTGGVARLNDDNAHRFVLIQPANWHDIVLTLPATDDCAAANALCTTGGEPLQGPVTKTIPGPFAVRAGQVSGWEGPTEFRMPVMLSRAGTAPVSVDYRTVNGTATAGEDYVAVQGTLTFEPGETLKEVLVPILDDVHDEGTETFKLKLSNAVGATIWHATGIGRIQNSDPMPQAWLARFGRTAAEHTFDAAFERTRATTSPGMSATVAGVTLGAGATNEDTEEGLDALARWMRESPLEAESRKVTGRDLLTGSTFSLTTGGNAPGAGTASLWGRGAISRFSGTEGEVTLDGEVASAIIGGDFSQGRWTAGAMVSHSMGDGDYTKGEHGGTIESTVTGLYPYGRYALGERVALWGVAGFGEGTLGLTREGQETIETDIDLAMAALGLRGVVVEAPAEGGPEIALATDALGVRTTSAAVAGDLVATEATVTRLRLGAESAWRGLELGAGTLSPRLELGLRHDDGDAETGFGVDVGAGLGWSDPARGFSAEVHARGLLTHESAGLSDRGFAGSIAYDPRPASDRGLSLTLRQAVGAQATGGMDSLLGHRTLEGLGAGDGDELSQRRLEMRVGYGLPAFGGRFTATPEVGLGLSEGARNYRTGWRLGLSRSGRTSVEVNLGATRRESAGADAPEHGVSVSLDARW